MANIWLVCNIPSLLNLMTSDSRLKNIAHKSYEPLVWYFCILLKLKSSIPCNFNQKGDNVLQKFSFWDLGNNESHVFATTWWVNDKIPLIFCIMVIRTGFSLHYHNENWEEGIWLIVIKINVTMLKTLMAPLNTVGFIL